VRERERGERGSAISLAIEMEKRKKRGGKIERGEVKGSLMRRDMPRQEGRGREKIVLGGVGEREKRER
jgi:hypothetical protein